MNTIYGPGFAPELFIPNGITDIEFYKNAFAATELFRFTNEDGSIHVAELAIDNSIFHLHEEMPGGHTFSAQKHNGGTVIIGLFVDDVDRVMQNAVAAGAQLISPAQDYDYGYRQGEIKDPFGHLWMIQKKIGNNKVLT
jgi:PhnB protein